MPSKDNTLSAKELNNLRHGVYKRITILQSNFRTASEKEQEKIKKELEALENYQNKVIAHLQKEVKKDPSQAPYDWNVKTNQPKNIDSKELRKWKSLPHDTLPSLEFPKKDQPREKTPSPTKEPAKESQTRVESPSVPTIPQEEQASTSEQQTLSSPQKKEEQAPPSSRTISPNTSRMATVARPEVYSFKEAEKRLPLAELQRLRRGLQRTLLNNTRNAQGKEGTELEKLQRERDKIDKALNSAIGMERIRYESGKVNPPSDWEGVAPKPLPSSEIEKYSAVSVDKLPAIFEEIPERVKRYFGKEPGNVSGESAKGEKFINNEIKRAVNDLNAVRKEADKLNQADPANKDRLKEYDRQMDEHKKRIKYLQKSKPAGVEDKWLHDDFKKAAKELQQYMTPEQLEAYKAGKPIDINKTTNKNAFLRGLREIGRTRDRINQSLEDELMWLDANPSNTIESFRALDPESRREELDDIKRDNFMRNLGEGIQGYYTKHKKPEHPELFEDVAPDEQKRWMKQYAAQEARKGAAGISGSDVYKFLFGGGEQFMSKYPPELYRPMVRSARRGLQGMEQLAQQLQPMAQQDPWERIYGDAAPAQRQFVTGAGQAPLVPELPQEYTYTPNQQGQGQQGLQQLLSQGLQQAPPPQAPNVSQVDQLINSKLENLLKGVQ